MAAARSCLVDPWHCYIRSGNVFCPCNTFSPSTNARKNFYKNSTPPHPFPTISSPTTHNPPTKTPSPLPAHTLFPFLSPSAKHPSPRKKETLTHSSQGIHLPLISTVRIQRAGRFQIIPYCNPMSTEQHEFSATERRLPGCDAETHAKNMTIVARKAVGFMLERSGEK